MSERFTPGPWTYFDKADGRADGYIRAGEVLPSATLPVAVARVCHRRPGEKEANAHLIAAAPDLYEACIDDPEPNLCALTFTENLLERVEINFSTLAAASGGKEDLEMELSEAKSMCRELRAAIKKAKGE